MICLLLSLVFPTPAWTEEKQASEPLWKRAKDTIVSDHKYFYSLRTLGHLTAGLGVGAIMAHTNVDRDIQDWYQDSVRDTSTDDFSEFVKPFGGGRITIPVFTGIALFGKLTEDTKVGSLAGEWATRTLRAMIVGAPPLLFFQKALGASRPDENDSHWRPFEDENGVSGHSFMGAVPFLSAAMMTDNRYIKSVFYLGSTFCGFSRINDDKHYFSQVALGWWLAYLSAKSVDKTEIQQEKVSIEPTVFNNGIGLGVRISF